MLAKKRVLGQPGEHAASFADGPAQLGDERFARNGPLLGKFEVALANVLRAAEPGHDPLAYVSAQMKHEVAQAIGIRVRPPPDFFVRQLGDAFLDAREILLQEGVLRLQKQCLRRERILLGFCFCFGRPFRCHGKAPRTRMLREFRRISISNFESKSQILKLRFEPIR